MHGLKPTLAGFKKSGFFLTVFLICLAYITFEYFFISYEALSADEFVFARHIYEYTFHLPYRDFSPYKTVLGYYLLSIPMFFSHSLLAPLFYIKDEIALINMGFIALSSYWAARYFDKRAVMLAMLAIIANQHFLIYAVDLRVDMLTSWFCLFAALCVLQNYLRWGGILLGIAFLVSQKALWYFFAINGAMLICWITLSSSFYSLRSLITFTLAFSAPIFLYFVSWSLIATPSIVLNNLFYEAYIQSGIDWFTPILLSCWIIVLFQGPLLFFLWPLASMSLCEKFSDSVTANRRIFIVSFSSLALLLFISYKQPFPYNFVFTIPAFFLLYADFISWLIFQKNSQIPIKNRPSISFMLIVALYTLAIFYLVNVFALPTVNNFIALLPISISLMLYARESRLKITLVFGLITTIFIATGIMYPLYRTYKGSYILNGSYQQAMLESTARLLENDGDYIGGIPFLYSKDQPIDGMKNLIGPSLAYLKQPDKNLESLFLSSIYLTPATKEKILADLNNSSVKIIINNFRLVSLPTEIKNYFSQNYHHFYGSIYIYAPQIHRNQLSFYIKFTAPYRIEGKRKTSIIIDGKKHYSGQIIPLEKGDHITDANHTYRLTLVPDINMRQLDPAYERDNWVYMNRAILS